MNNQYRLLHAGLFLDNIRVFSRGLIQGCLDGLLILLAALHGDLIKFGIAFRVRTDI